MRALCDLVGHPSSPMLSRRALLRASLGTSAGLAGILLARQAPVLAQERELKLLTWSHFVPASDEELQRQLEEFGKMAGIKVRMDRVAHLQIPAVHATQVQGQKGHDITFMWIGEPHLYSNHLINLDDLVDKIGQRAGGWTDQVVGRGEDGSYRAVPWYFISFPVAIRTDLVAEIGEDLPDTWEDVHRIGKKLKAKGHPVGIQLAHSFDSNAILRGIIWSWGGKLVEADGKTVAINSKETVEAYKFIKALYEDCMEPEVLAWDDRNNNVCLNSGKCSMILNPISAYNSARKDNALIPGTNIPIHIVINHIMPPKGPAGRHMCAAYNVIGIWKWSPVQELAKEFLDYHFQKEQQDRFIRASQGYNQPFLQAFTMHPIYASNPKFYFAPYIGWYTHAPGWPGTPTAATQVVWDKYIIPDTAAECATGKLSAEEAVKKAEFQIKREYRRRA
ncbi:MAG: ABC transporter substrate-binding protein [Candidatus Tectimicrobiota bacterium]|nr:MAG: ABC transporter substrate-binding protein [Candidatus Tectomicrobia bacterium]